MDLAPSAGRLGFVLLLALVLYPYTLYPGLLWLLGRLRPRPWRREAVTPTLSVVLAAHNEARVIREKLENTLALDYPPEKLEIVVASDGSTDATNDIVAGFAPRVRLLPLATRGGKQVALNQAAAQTQGEILLFTDAAVFFDRGLARFLAENFADPNVGAVSSVIRIVSPEGRPEPPTATVKASASPTASVGATPGGAQIREAEGAYLDFDLTVRRLEAAVGSAVGCCGSCYAVRRDCFRPFHPADCNDFASALDAVRSGKRVVLDERAVGTMLPARSGNAEFRRKARTMAGGLDTLWRSQWLLHPWPHPLFWWQLVSHKVARWLGPPALAAAWILAVVEGWRGDRLLAVAAVVGLVPVVGGVLALLLPPLARRLSPARYSSFALIAVAASLVAWWWFLTGRRQVLWQPTVR